jgi:UV DNA damage repair endonuclease
MQVRCSACETLREKAVTAMTRHYQLLSQLEIARISHNSEVIGALEPLVESAWAERLEANEAYQAHLEDHSARTTSGRE